ncbi:GNAT family N-acetyltransferase [Paenibacillus marinisediminis]
MTITIRNIHIPEDYGQIADLLNYILSEQTDAEKLADEDSKIPSTGMLGKNEAGLLIGFDRYRIVAVDEDDKLVGYGISWRAPWTAAGKLNHTLVVAPSHRNQGIGTELYNRLEQWASSNGASELCYEVRDDAESAVSFAEKMGYEVERHSYESVLDLSSFDRNKLKDMNPELTVLSLSEIKEADKELKLYELYKETSYDIPGFDGEFFEFNEWRKWTLELPGSKPEYVLIAMDQDRYIGVVHLLHHPSTQSVYHEYTGVKKEYRGQGIGLTLKLKSIELALNLDMKYMRTNNDSLNKPMLRINRDQLHFIAVPGNYRMVKKL